MLTSVLFFSFKPGGSTFPGPGKESLSVRVWTGLVGVSERALSFREAGTPEPDGGASQSLIFRPSKEVGAG